MRHRWAGCRFRRTPCSRPASSSLSEGLTANYYYLYVDGIDAQVNYRFDTDIGSFTVGDNLTQTLKFDDAYSYKQAPTASQIFSTLNTDGINTSFPTLATSMRGHVGWQDMGIAADFYVNYSSAYRNVASSAANPIVNNPTTNLWGGTGGDHVDANVTFDLHLGYSFDPNMFGGMFGGEQLSLVVNNVFDKTPPFYNSSSGYDSTVANPIGRNVTLGLTANF